MITFYVGIAIVIVYIQFMLIKNQHIPESVSDTYYEGAGYWFTIIMFIASFLIIIGMLDMTDGSYLQFVSFFTGAGMALVGAAPNFKTGERLVHYTGASVLLFGSQIWLIIFGNPWVLLIWLSTPLWWKDKRRIFWIEILCLLNILIGI